MTEENNKPENIEEKKPIYKQKKGIIGIIIGVCCLGILVLAATGMLIPDNSNTSVDTNSDASSSEESVNTEDTSSSDNTASALQVRITYDGAWSGAIGTAGESTSYDGTGDQTIDLPGSSWDIVSASIQKQGGGSGELKVEILKDGKVVKESSTTAAYGVVAIAD